ncbi:putative ring-h2 finger protein atl21a [Quercus suber]|uniref:RING-type E3 ubiquitin transferase n=1 Tax=Quercus suber TaxID=58331 RepID=A0AAW0JK95_QUESU
MKKSNPKQIKPTLQCVLLSSTGFASAPGFVGIVGQNRRLVLLGCSSCFVAWVDGYCWVVVRASLRASLILSSTGATARNHVRSNFHRQLSPGFGQNRHLGSSFARRCCWVRRDLGERHNSCPELRCGDDGPPIRFPFRLKDRQPDQHCGYPGFDLYCSHNNDTVLKLPTSVKAFVKHIDYKSQLIIGLQLSSLPFQFKNSLSDYALFSCTPDTEYSYQVHSLNGASTSVLAFPSDYDIDDLPILSCTKMYTVSSVPSDIWSSSLELTWSGPKCGHCEGKGKICRFKNNSTDLKTECFDPNKDKGIVLFPPNFHFYNHTSSVSCQHILILSKIRRSRKIMTTVSILGSFLLTLVVYALYRWHPVDRPSMKVVVQMLEGEGDKLTMPPNPFSSTNPTRINVSMHTRCLNPELEVILESE